METDMNRERLQQMVTMLRELPEEQFDLADWQCGTTACAVGHACLHPWFNDQGLMLLVEIGDDAPSPSYQGSFGWSAVEEFFDLSAVDAEYLFYRFNYPNWGDFTTAADVADRIELRLQDIVEA
jgi:hypothetical protein